MISRTYLYLFIVILTQILNLLYITYCVLRGDFLPSIIIGGLGRIFTDGIFVYLSWRKKMWATYTVVALWGCVAITALFLAFRCVCRGETVNGLGLFSIAGIYSLLSFTLVMASKWSFPIRSPGKDK